MDEAEVKTLVLAASDLLDAIDSEDIAIDIAHSKLSFGAIRELLNSVMVSVWAFDDLLEGETKDEVPAGVTRQ